MRKQFTNGPDMASKGNLFTRLSTKSNSRKQEEARKVHQLRQVELHTYCVVYLFMPIESVFGVHWGCHSYWAQIKRFWHVEKDKKSQASFNDSERAPSA